jgi:putative ABC transport system permease protein
LLQGLLALAPTDLPRVAKVQIDAQVLVFTAALTLLTSLLFGLLPTWQATRGTRFMIFNLGARSSTLSPARRRLFDSLMVAEVGLALILLTGAGLMTRTIYKLSQVDPGFRRDHLLTMRFDLSGPKYDDKVTKQEAFLRDAAARLKVLPGVAGAGFTGSLPIQGSEWGSVFIVGDKAVPERSKIPVAAFNLASPGYLETMQIGLRRGRLFTEADGPDAPKVAVINETMARRFWQDEDPIGKRLKQGWPESDTPWREVVGVVADVKLNGITEETPLHVYLPIAQEGGDSLSLVLRTQLDPASIAASAQAAIHEVDPDLPLYHVRTMDEIFSRATLRQRGAMILLTAFAILAMLLAAVGIYGVISWGVAQRAREMGVRMALGAQQFDVLWLVLRRNMLLVFGGVGLGLCGAFALTRVLSSLLSETGTGKTPLLFGVNVVDPLTFIAVPLLLSFVALLACVLPARRATKVDPMVVLRYE